LFIVALEAQVLWASKQLLLQPAGEQSLLGIFVLFYSFFFFFFLSPKSKNSTQRTAE
jgi:hypothetical protein